MGKRLTAVEAAAQILDANRRGEDVVSVVSTAGASAGLRILAFADGSFEGELADRTDAGHALAQRVLETRASVFEDGLFAEIHTPADQLIIFGAGHIAVPLAELAVKLDFSTIVLDDRSEFADAARFPAQARVLPLDLGDPLKQLTITPSTYLVLVTRAHAHDFDLLRAVLALPEQPRYIGMIGSRRRVRAAFTALLDGGIARDRLTQIHAPVGLDIGAETPAEIAVSIAAELVRVRRRGSSASLASEERVLDRFFAETPQ